MARKTRTRKVAAKPSGAELDSLLEMVRSLWNATEQADTAVRDWSQKAIVDGIARLNRQVTSKLRLAAAIPPVQPRLFSEEEESEQAPSADAKPADHGTTQVSSAEQVPCMEAESAYPESSQPRFPEPKLRTYAKALTKQALTFIPQAGGFSTHDAYREHLATTLPFNSHATQRRNASYLISRYFPGDCFNSDLSRFAAAMKETPALGESLFYLTCRTEKIVAQVADEVVFPSLPQAGVARTKIRDYIQSQFPESKSAKQAANACVETYTAFGIGSATRSRLNVSLREGSLASFAYVLHLEFPEPGMYGFERILDGPMHTWLLWDRSWMIRQLYILREAGLLSKVSEIDRMRQFTTKYPLAAAVSPILALAKEAPA